jgi:hypothetical protein
MRDDIIKHHRHTPAILSVLLFVFGTLYCLYYGRIGYMALDHSHVFDGGWRMLNGQIPFRDFTLPNTILPVVMQPIFFKLFGVNWFALCLHAAVLNGLFSVLVFYFLKLYSNNDALAFFYALLSGVIFYTPFGVPVQDQHAYFFTFLLILMAFSAITSTNPKLRMALWAGLPTVSVLAYLSKQIPTIFGVFFVYVVLAIAERKNYRQWITATLIGISAALASLVALYFALGIDLELLRVYYLNLPLETGAERIHNLFSSNFTATVRYMTSHWQLFFPFAAVTALFLVGMFRIGQIWFVKKSRVAFSKAVKDWHLPLLAQALLLICFVFASLTLNQIENCVPLMFVALGLLHIFFLSSNRISGQAHVRKRVLIVISTLLMAGTLFCAAYFDRRVNRTRMVNDLIYREDAPDAGPANIKGLEFMIWAVPRKYPGTPADFRRFLEFFAHHKENFYLIGDSSILYALTDRPSMNPVLWYHPREALPQRTSPYFADYQVRQINALINNNVKYIVLEYCRHRRGALRTTWLGVSLSYFPVLDKIVQTHEKARQTFGPFTIIELDRPIDEQMVSKLLPSPESNQVRSNGVEKEP